MAACRVKNARTLRWAPALILLLGFKDASAESDARARHELFLGYLKQTAAELTSQCLSRVGNLGEWEKQRPRLRQQLLYMLGLDPLPKRTPLSARVEGKLDRPSYRIEKVIFQSLPGLYVTGNFYLPKTGPGPYPAILYVCGHSPHPLGAKWNYQDRAAWFASQGFACLILDTLEFGEVAGIHHGIHDLNLWNWLSLGYTPAGTEVWNAMRGLDYLETRPEVDKKAFGITGISGGGAITWFTAAVDERIQAVAPVCATYTFGSQAAHWVAAGQCDCIYFHNTFLEDFPIVGALIAPRPLIIFSGQKDPDFPPDGYHQVFAKVKKIYDLYAAASTSSDRVREIDADTGHTDAPLFLKEARQWMKRWLKDDVSPYQEYQPAKENAEDLACFPKLPADAVNYKIHKLLTPVTLKNWTSLPQWNRRRQELLMQLKDKVFRWFPGQAISFETKVTRSTGGWAGRYADFKEAEFNSEPGVRVRVQLLTPKNGRSENLPLLIYAKRAGDSIYPLDFDEFLPVFGRYTVLILNPRLTEHPVSAFEYAEIERTASWIGRTVASMQVWDILRAVEWLAQDARVPASSISVYGKGDMGILALYAGLFDERIQQVILSDPPASHWKGPALLNVLRVTDIPEVAGALAPRRLISLTELPRSFEYARTIYQLHSRSTNLSQADSLPEALEVWRY